MNYAISFYKQAEGAESACPKLEYHDWNSLVALFSIHDVGPKDGLAFIAGVFQEDSRKAKDLIERSCLVLDYDHEVTIAAIRFQLRGIKHLGYTSFSHLKDGVTEKFRVVIPLQTPIKTEDWNLRRKGFAQLFPEADGASWNPVQLMFMPRCLNEELAQRWTAEGDALDWNLIPAVEKRAPQVRDPVVKGAKIDGLPIFHLGSGERYQADVLYTILQEGYDYRRSCFKLDAPDSKPGCFVYRHGLGLRYYDNSTGETHYIPVFKADKKTKLELAKKVISAKELQAEIDKLEDAEEKVIDDAFAQVPKIERTFNPPMERTKMTKLITNFLSSNTSAHTVIRAAEGAGKSTIIVKHLLERGHKVCFCCDSNKQANGKMVDFAQHGPQRCWSFGALIFERFGVKPVTKPTTTWGMPDTDLDATVEAILAKDPKLSDAEVLAELDVLKAQALDSKVWRSDLIITTFARGSITFNERYGQSGYTFVVDDPNRSTLLTAKVDGVGPKASAPVTRKIEDTVFGRRVFELKQKQLDGTLKEETVYPTDKVIWTTTEELVLLLLKHHHPDINILNVEETIDTERRILLWPTKLAYKTFKPLLKSLHAYNTPEKHFIANGVRSDHNLVSTKGSNLMTGDSVIVISHLHPLEKASIRLSLGNDVDEHAIQRMALCDDLNQALGRTHGYRGDETQSLVLCSLGLRHALLNGCRYKLNMWDDASKKGKVIGKMQRLISFLDDKPRWWEDWIGDIKLYERELDEVDGRVFHLGHETKIEDLHPRLRKPFIKTGEFKWKAVDVMVEVEGSRLRHLIHVLELEKKLNEREVTTTSELKLPRLRKYYHPLCEKGKLFRQGSQPEDWSGKKLKRK